MEGQFFCRWREEDQVFPLRTTLEQRSQVKRQVRIRELRGSKNLGQAGRSWWSSETSKMCRTSQQMLREQLSSVTGAASLLHVELHMDVWRP